MGQIEQILEKAEEAKLITTNHSQFVFAKQKDLDPERAKLLEKRIEEVEKKIFSKNHDFY